MSTLNNLLSIIISILQFTTGEVDTEFDPVEVYNFLLIFLGIVLLIIILIYILLTSKQE